MFYLALALPGPLLAWLTWVLSRRRLNPWARSALCSAIVALGVAPWPYPHGLWPFYLGLFGDMIVSPFAIVSLVVVWLVAFIALLPRAMQAGPK